jgi:hypothetical protein
VLCVFCVDRLVSAQPDPRQMAGIPRPVTDLPAGSISVRLLRGSLTNNITNHPVQLHVGNSKVLTVNTDDMGRAQFDHVMPNATVKATADVDGEHLESQEFPAPAEGGIRLLLVATDKSQAAVPNVPSAPAVTGQVVLGPQTRFVIEPGEENVQLFYLIEIVNAGRAPVNTATAFSFDMPTEATGTTLLEGSSPLASVNGTHVLVKGPFPPGSTLVQLACDLPAMSGSVEVRQTFPAALGGFGVIVKKVGDVKLESAQVTAQQDLTAEGDVYIGGQGGAVAAGQPLVLSVTGIVHHSAAPMWTALSVALGIILFGGWAAWKPRPDGLRELERKRLLARRDKLFNELVRLEREYRGGKVAGSGNDGARRYATRRDELVTALEQIYGGLDDDSDQGDHRAVARLRPSEFGAAGPGVPA